MCEHGKYFSLPVTNKIKLQACLFNKKTYEGRNIFINPAEKQQYGTYLYGIPSCISNEDIVMYLKRTYEERVCPNIHYKKGAPGGSGYVMVNFTTEETRQQVRSS